MWAPVIVVVYCGQAGCDWSMTVDSHVEPYKVGSHHVPFLSDTVAPWRDHRESHTRVLQQRARRASTDEHPGDVDGGR